MGPDMGPGSRNGSESGVKKLGPKMGPTSCDPFPDPFFFACCQCSCTTWPPGAVFGPISGSIFGSFSDPFCLLSWIHCSCDRFVAGPIAFPFWNPFFRICSGITLTLRRPPRMLRGRGHGTHVGSIGACPQQKRRGCGRKRRSFYCTNSLFKCYLPVTWAKLGRTGEQGR